MLKKLRVNTMGRPQDVTPLLTANNLGKCIKTHRRLLLDKCLCMTQAKTGHQLKLCELVIQVNLSVAVARVKRGCKLLV